MSTLADEIARLEAEAAATASFRVENADLEHCNDELRQRIADLEDRVDALQDQIADLKRNDDEDARERLDQLSDECACIVEALDDFVGVKNLPIGLRLHREEVAAMVGPHAWR